MRSYPSEKLPEPETKLIDRSILSMDLGDLVDEALRLYGSPCAGARYRSVIERINEIGRSIGMSGQKTLMEF